MLQAVEHDYELTFQSNYTTHEVKNDPYDIRIMSQVLKWEDWLHQLQIKTPWQIKTPASFKIKKYLLYQEKKYWLHHRAGDLYTDW